MSRFTISIAIVLLAIGCTNTTPDLERATTAELAAAPSSFEGMALWFDGDFTLGVPSCTAVACMDRSVPCNDCAVSLAIVDPATGEATIALVPAEPWPYDARAAGEYPNGCIGGCPTELPLGCSGNDLEMDCAPAVPSRIVAVHGTVQHNSSAGDAFAVYEWSLVVDTVELADGPLDETVSGVHLIEQ